MLKFVVLCATVAFSAAQNATVAAPTVVTVLPPVAGSSSPLVVVTAPTPNPKQCKANYLRDAQMCGTVPKLIDEKQFEQCHKGGKGKNMREQGGAGSSEEEGAAGNKRQKMRQQGGAGSSEEQGADTARNFRGKGQRGGDDGPESDVAPGDAQLEAMTAPRRGKRGKKSRSKREPHRGGMKKMAYNAKRGDREEGPACSNCMMECVFNSSGLLDASKNVVIAAVKTQFVAKAPANSSWANLISTAVDSCWTDAQNAPAPTSPPSAPADKKQCKQQALLLMQCVQRSLIINTPAAEQIKTAGDCDARIQHLKNCDPMIPAFRDFEMKKGQKMGGKFGKSESAPLASMAGKKGRKAHAGKKSANLRRKAKTTVAA